jgi:putative ABC transport system permease protein
MPLGERVYRLLLRAYPAQFRENYEREMVHAFGELRKRDGAAAAWLRVLADLAASVPAEHARALRQDLRFASRKLASSPAAVALIALTLGAGVGPNVALYSAVDALLFRPLPVNEPESFVVVGRGPGVRETSSYLDYRDLRDRNTTFSQLSATFAFPALLGHEGSEERRLCGLVSGNYFASLGIQPFLGRFISDEDDGAPGTGAVAVLSHSLWRTRFAADRGVLGETIVLNDRKFTIIGVAPENFHGTMLPLATQLYAPLSMHTAFVPGIVESEATRDQRWLSLFGRLKPGLTPTQAEANLNVIERQIQNEHPELGTTDEQRRDRILSVAVPQGVWVPHLRRAISRGAAFMMAVTGLLVLLACVNVAGLMLARATAREREMAVRMALGASRRRIVREMLTESVLLGLTGAAAGLLLAYYSVGLFNNLQTPMQGAWQFSLDARIDVRVLAYALAVAFTTALVFGLTPALQATRRDPHAALKEGLAGSRGSRTGNRMRRALVVGQFTMAVALLAATGLLVRSLRNLYDADPGFETGRQAYAYLILTNESEGRRQFVEDLKREAGALPGVTSAALTSNPPVRLGNYSQMRVRIAGGATAEESGAVQAGTVRVDADFFSTTGIALTRGRTFHGDAPARTRDVVIVNETLAQRLWPGSDAVGQYLRLDDNPAEHEVVGVARDSKYFSLAEEPQPFLYQPLDTNDGGRISVIVRTSGPPASLVAPLRDLIRRLDPVVDTSRLGTFEEALEQAIWPTRMAVQHLSGFSVLALLLTATGLFGLMANLVEQRRHEIALRMALGATGREVTRLFLKRGARLAATGIVLGIGAALAVTRMMAGFVSGVSTADPWTYCAVALLLLAVALLASWAPAHRAARVDPISALRE